MFNVMRIQEGVWCIGYRGGSRGSHNDFLSDLNQRAVAAVALRQGGIPQCHKVQLLAVIP